MLGGILKNEICAKEDVIANGKERGEQRKMPEILMEFR